MTTGVAVQTSAGTALGDVAIHAESAVVRWPTGDTSTLPYLWLRDNCGCPACRVVQTSEKRFMLADVPFDLRPVEVALVGDRLKVTWPDGHETCYVGSDIRALDRRDAPAWTGWDRAFLPPRTDYAAFLEDDASASSAIGDFLKQGALILENAPTDRGTLETLAPRFGPIREVLFSRVHDVVVDPTGYNVAHTALALPPHNDFASYAWPPSVQALHMLANEVPDGESVIVDGWRVLTRLREDHPDWFEALRRTSVPFREFDEDNETYAVAPIVQCSVDGAITCFRFSNQLMQAIDPNQRGAAEFYRAYHELCRRLTDPAVQATFRLESGEILLLASHRVLHGRKAFEPNGARHLQDAYFEFDNVRNHLVVLRRRGAAPRA